MRLQHYFFAHKLLPAMLFEGHSLLGILANPDNQDFLLGKWEEMARQAQQEDPNDDPISPEQLKYSSHMIGGDQLAILIQMPTPKVVPEAYFCAITTGYPMRYFTLELGTDNEGKQTGFLCSWTEDGTHLNHGPGVPPIAEVFLKAICNHLRLPEVIDAPDPVHLQGMSKNKVFYAVDQPTLGASDATKVRDLEDRAEKALDGGEYAAAEGLFLQAQKLKLEVLGPQNTHATLAFLPILLPLRKQGKFQEAYDLARGWYRLCRMHRMPGHAETLSAMRECAHGLKDLGQPQEALKMMKGRLLYAKAARGGDSLQATQAGQELEDFFAELPSENSDIAHTNAEGKTITLSAEQLMGLLSGELDDLDDPPKVIGKEAPGTTQCASSRSGPIPTIFSILAFGSVAWIAVGGWLLFLWDAMIVREARIAITLIPLLTCLSLPTLYRLLPGSVSEDYPWLTAVNRTLIAFFLKCLLDLVLLVAVIRTI